MIQTNLPSSRFLGFIGLKITVPWGREASGQQEAAANVGAIHQRYDAVLFDIVRSLGKARAHLGAARQTASLLRRENLPQARATLRAVLAAYGQGRSAVQGGG